MLRLHSRSLLPLVAFAILSSILLRPGSAASAGRGHDGAPAPPPPSREVQERLSALAADAVPVEATAIAPRLGRALAPDRIGVPGDGGPEAAPAAVPDNTGGDDVEVFLHDQLGDFDIDIAANGDIYLAVEVESATSGPEIRVFQSQDGGDSWIQWARVWNADPDEVFYSPSLHIAEGTEDNLLLACSHHETLHYWIDVYRLPLGAPPATLTVSVALDVTDVYFVQPDITSDAVNFFDYYVYLVAEGHDDDDGADIWFARSPDQGETWETGYRIGSLTLSDRDYLSPEIEYGYGGCLHAVWAFDIWSGDYDYAIRYRRATSYASGGIGAWDGLVAVTPYNDGTEQMTPVVAASPTGNAVVLAYTRADTSHVLVNGHMRLSTDQGDTWPELLYAQFAGYLPGLARVRPGTDWHLGAQHPNFGTANFHSSPAADPLTFGGAQTLSDRNVQSWTGYNRALATDPTRGNRVAMAWTGLAPGPDSLYCLYFDAEWRGDPGYPNFEDGFPVPLTSWARTPPAVVNIDDDPELEIVFSDSVGYIQVFNHDGTPVSGWPVQVGIAPFPGGAVAVGDLDGDGTPELVAGTEDGWVHVLDNDGTPHSGFPVDLGTGENTFVAVGTFGEPFYRLIAATSGTKLFVLNHLGESRGEGYPVTFTGVHVAGPAIGDVDGDGVTEIVTTRDNFVHVHKLTGAVPQMYRNLGANIVTNDAPTLADFDLDGDLEIAVSTRDGHVYLMHDDGADYAGSWPFAAASGSPATSAALADLDGVSAPELSFAARSWEVYCLNADGTARTGYPQATGSGWYILGSPIVDGVVSGEPSVVVGARDSSGWAWTGTGDTVPGWPRNLGAHCNLSPAAGDIDLDGRNEFAFVTAGSLLVFDVNQPPEGDSRGRWPMYAHDPMRTGNLGGAVPVTAVPEGQARLRVRFAAPSPNPARDRVQLAYELPVHAAVRITVHDAQGRLVRRLFRAEQEPGAYELAWDGCADRGQPAAAGLYYLRLETRGPGVNGVETRKAVLLR